MILVALILTATAACGRSTPPASGASGIEGRTVAGPQCPVVRAGSPCPDAPIAAEVRVTQDGREITRFTTSSDGRFRVALSPGMYILEPVSTGRFPSGKPQEVTVASGAYTHVNVMFDTGIR